MVQGPVPPAITPPLPSSSLPPRAGHSSAVSATLSPTTPRTRIRMAPTSPTYDRLEAGRMPLKQSRRFAWKKFAMGAGILLVLVWLFVPKEKRQISMSGWGGSPEFEKGNTPYEGKPKPSGPAEDALEPPPSRPKPPVPPSPADKNPAHPTSFETDPDPTKTTYCKSPHSSAERLVQYALMLDAGSTGSRIHVYKFNNCGPSPAYEYETFKMTPKDTGGLSAYAGRPLAAANSLDILMDEAMRVVPLSLRKCTPVAVKATAGLRLLPGSQSSDIIGAVMDHLRDAYPFALPTKPADAVAIMDGADEGVFAWVTANYLLGTVRADSAPNTPTFAVLDLGGASTQIVFEPKAGAPLHEGEHKYDLDFGGRTRVLYQHSYLGYGLMRARASVHRVVDFMASLHEGPPAPKTAAGLSTVSNPCLARGTQRTIGLAADGGVKKEVQMDGADVGGFAACMKIVDLVMAKDAVCAVRPCAFGGVYQPALSEAFPPSAGRVLLLSYFYDRVAPLMPEPLGGEQLSATVEAIAELAKVVCGGRDKWLAHNNWGTKPELMDELEGRPEWCLDLTFMYGLLRTGYEFDGDREVMFGKKIAGTELGWCLGAGIKLVGGVDVQCRV
ncbi:nucleoside phosphatase family-domain-containing protein [Mycena metata]|uniref:guanosine-diphosphatase n=1 Tax=Mycena metata TaxID=1033252 RepID=A0AAD7I9U9_9AGAR|nr:nucleoside phosphatase family-domain-containing protein [Mycena metata]